MSPVYLVDGSGYIFRAYYAVQPLSTSKGLPTNALIGFTRMLAKLLRDVSAEHIAVMFDTGAKTFRHEMFDAYKANRGECPEDLVPQMPYFRKIVEAMGIRHFEKEGFEADDIIATLCRNFASRDHEVVIVSGDKDLTQLVDEKTVVWDAMRDVRFTPAVVKEKFGVEPRQVLDYLALCGDSSDNIPGVKGVGPKSAQRLIEHFGSVENLIEKADEIGAITGLRGAKSVQKKIESGVELLRLSRELVRLDEAVAPFDEIVSLEELCLTPPDDAVLHPLFEELEFNSLLATVSAGRKPKALEPVASKNYTTLTPDTFDSFLAELKQQSAFAFDTETSSLDPRTCELVGISISWQDDTGYYLPFVSGDSSEDSSELSKAVELLDLDTVRSGIQPIFADPDVKKIGANLKYDVSVLAEQGIVVKGLSFDAMLCAYVLNPDRRDFGLKALTSLHLDEQMKPFKEVLGDKEHIGQVPLAEVAEYACHDADASWKLREVLDAKLGENSEDGVSLRRVFEEIEMPLVEVLSELERVGIAVDLDMLEKLSLEFTADIERLRQEIFVYAGCEFNVNSPKQLAAILFEELGISTQGVKKTKTGFSTNAAVLEKLVDTHPIVKALLEYREVHKLNSTYVESLKNLVHPKTGRIHASFNQAVAATGRLSSSDPNLQNIPIRNERGRRIRDAFIPEKGNLFIAADYSQIELRILAHLSEDEAFIEAFQNREDIHMRTAKEIFGAMIGSESEQKELRRVAKTINFGIIYGMSAFRLAREINVSRTQAQSYIDQYFARYPRVLEYFDRVAELAEKQGYVETMFGRRRYLEELDISGRDAGYAGRSMLNAPIQGSAAEIIKIAMVNLHKVLAQNEGSARMVLQVHDELVVEARESDAERIRDLIVEEMEGAVSISVPLVVDARIGRSWGGPAL
jgi:DNA polymerase-1